MTLKIGHSTVLLFCVLGLATAEVTLNASWKENFGWVVTCAWKTWLNDTVQSVRMARNGNQFFIFRPEIHGESLNWIFQSPEFLMNIDCKMIHEGRKGRCVVKMELLAEANEDTFKCEMSGEKPTFRLEEREYTVFVPPSDATLNLVNAADPASPLRGLICESSGIPAPELMFTGRIPGDFSRTAWNSTTKLWHTWATYKPRQDKVLVTCTPEVSTKLGSVERGKPALWNFLSSSGCCLGVIKLILLGPLITSLLR